MKEEIKDILKKYADLKIAIKDLELQTEELNPQILEYMQNENLEEIPTSVGKFILSGRRTYTYSAEIKKIETDLKTKKKEAEALGTAEFVEKKYLTFKAGASEE